MANITVNLEVDNEQFKQLCVDNINDLPKDKMEELLLKAVETALIAENKSPVRGSGLLVEKVNNDYWDTRYQPTELLKTIMKNIDTEKYFKPIADKICQYIADNYEELVKKYMIECITRKIFVSDNQHVFNDMLMNHLNHN